MRVGVVVEPDPEERRVALVPSVLPTLAQSGLSVLLQQGAGEKAGFPDVAYQEQGAQLAPTAEQVLAETTDAPWLSPPLAASGHYVAFVTNQTLHVFEWKAKVSE